MMQIIIVYKRANYPDTKSHMKSLQSTKLK